MRLRTPTSLIGLLLVVTIAATACSPAADTASSGSATPSHTVMLPPAGGAPDYQLGGAYENDNPAVTIVARDRSDPPADPAYSICYVNGFQTQPGEQDVWPADTLLRDAQGEPVIDPDWPDEVLLDTSTEAQRAAIVEVVAPWIRGCANDGFDAVEFDNLDTFTRSDGALTTDDNTALAADLVAIAHDAGLAAAQKNAAELATALQADAGFDFAIAEECVAYDECTAYTEVYGDHVIAIEYPDTLTTPFAEACADPDTPASVVLRDRDLVTPDDPGYLFELC